MSAFNEIQEDRIARVGTTKDVYSHIGDKKYIVIEIQKNDVERQNVVKYARILERINRIPQDLEGKVVIMLNGFDEGFDMQHYFKNKSVRRFFRQLFNNRKRFFYYLSTDFDVLPIVMSCIYFNHIKTSMKVYGRITNAVDNVWIDGVIGAACHIGLEKSFANKKKEQVIERFLKSMERAADMIA